MLGHDHFESVCAAATRGEATAEELAEFDSHARECECCRGSYAEMLAFAAREFAVSRAQGLAGTDTGLGGVDSDALTTRFLDRLAREGLPAVVAPPGAVARAVRGGALGRLAGPAWVPRAMRLAATLLTGVALGGAAVAWWQVRGDLPRAGAEAIAGAEVEVRRLTSELRASQARLDTASGTIAAALQRDLESGRRYQELERRVQRLQASLASAKDALAAAEQDAGRSRDRAVAAEVTAAANRARVDALQPLADDARTARERARAAEAVLADTHARVEELTGELRAANESLERHRQLMALSRDVTDLMGARNLHIVDVVDTDPQGRDRKAFGRVFFTENKSLIFYAYDLNEARIQKANFEYRVWARKESDPDTVHDLGIFYSDTTAQRRWVFKCNDQKVLSEIDSVFVTLEPANRKATTPNGSQLLYAYLRGQPNHQ
ncbi:MAG: hypothetical protein AB1806_00900 [Acidobacteriota bacterium]